MAVADKTKVINETNAVISTLQSYKSYSEMGCGLIPLIGLASFLAAYLALDKGFIDATLTSIWMMFLLGIAFIFIMMSLESLLSRRAVAAFNAKFPEKLRAQDRQIALDHIAGLNTKNDGIHQLLKALGYKTVPLEAAPENQLAGQISQLEKSPDARAFNPPPVAESKAPLKPPAPAKPVATPAAAPVADGEKTSQKPGGKKIIPLDPFEDNK